ncbi:MAG: hypothetical protein ACR2RD_00130 [Woeseiaceae bacterium]
MADGTLTVRAKEAHAQLERRDATLTQVLLPKLEVGLSATAECPIGTEAESLTIGVSDTHQHYRAEQLDDAGTLDTKVSVPASQLAPVSIPGFCVRGEAIEEKADQGLKLPGVATAQVSLQCRSNTNSTSVYFTSIPIPVRLYCRADDEPAPSSEDR